MDDRTIVVLVILMWCGVILWVIYAIQSDMKNDIVDVDKEDEDSDNKNNTLTDVLNDTLVDKNGNAVTLEQLYKRDGIRDSREKEDTTKTVGSIVFDDGYNIILLSVDRENQSRIDNILNTKGFARYISSKETGHVYDMVDDRNEYYLYNDEIEIELENGINKYIGTVNKYSKEAYIKLENEVDENNNEVVTYSCRAYKHSDYYMQIYDELNNREIETTMEDLVESVLDEFAENKVVVKDTLNMKDTYYFIYKKED